MSGRWETLRLGRKPGTFGVMNVGWAPAQVKDMHLNSAQALSLSLAPATVLLSTICMACDCTQHIQCISAEMEVLLLHGKLEVLLLHGALANRGHCAVQQAYSLKDDWYHMQLMQR